MKRITAILIVIACSSGLAPNAGARPEPTPRQWYRLRMCESSDRPTVVSRNGKWHGLYQFDQRTWNGVAKKIDRRWVGVKPSKAPRSVQDAMAKQLYRERGRAPWPYCGRKYLP